MSALFTTFRIHYRTEFGDFISVRGSSHGLSWENGIETSWISEGEEDVWVLSLPLNFHKDFTNKEEENDNNKLIHFKPLINDEVWAKGHDYIVRPGGTIDIYPFFFANNGSVFKTSFQSHSLKNERKIAIYLPPSYSENPLKRYPIILFQDGHNLFDTEDSFCGDTWQMAETMDDLSCHGGIQEYIVIGVYPLDREWEYLPTQYKGVGGGADKYLDALVGELLPTIHSHLRTLSSSPCCIAGSSYGGIISLYAWATRPSDFSLCGAFSPALKFDNSIVSEITKQSLSINRPHDHKLYLDCGTLKDQMSSVIELACHIDKNGLLAREQFQLIIGQGHEHSERHWAVRSPHALSFLLQDSSRSQPLHIFESECLESEYF